VVKAPQGPAAAVARLGKGARAESVADSFRWPAMEVAGEAVMDYTHSALPKGRTRKQAKATRDRMEAKVKAAVRAACVERDGYCRMDRHDAAGPCDGITEWAHLGEWKRAKTRGLPPEERHHTKGSVMLCRRHHRMYDSGEIVIEYGPDGANGPLTLWRKAA